MGKTQRKIFHIPLFYVYAAHIWVNHDALFQRPLHTPRVVSLGVPFFGGEGFDPLDSAKPYGNY